MKKSAPKQVPDKINDIQNTQPGSKSKFNLLEAVRLRVVKKWSLRDIGDRYGVSKVYVFQQLKKIDNLIDKPELTEAFQTVREQILNKAEMELLVKLLNSDTLAKASTNNIAYALRQVFDMRRLESGQSTQNVSSLLSLVQGTDTGLRSGKKRANIPMIEADNSHDNGNVDNKQQLSGDNNTSD
jgi:predicted DNA-binding protein YlxM (UPF0122 family)